jgi:hypothetical protein
MGAAICDRENSWIRIFFLRLIPAKAGTQAEPE